MGSKHPTYGFIYPVNYGYVPNKISGDREKLDCIEKIVINNFREEKIRVT